MFESNIFRDYNDFKRILFYDNVFYNKAVFQNQVVNKIFKVAITNNYMVFKYLLFFFENFLILFKILFS